MCIIRTIILEKIFLHIIIIFYVDFHANSQDFSKNLNDPYITLCKTWGFLKYHHPYVAEGSIDWDSVLVDAVVKIEKGENHLNVILNMIDNAGACPVCENVISDTGFIHYDIFPFWRKNTNTPEIIVERLERIAACCRPVDNYYVQLRDGVGNTVYDNEKKYEYMIFPELPFRLLSLFRLWNAMEYFYPYKHLADVNWDQMLYHGVVEMQQCTDSMEYFLVLRKLCASLDDNHIALSVGFFDDWVGSNFLNFMLKYDGYVFYVNNLVQGFSQTDQLLKHGDIVHEINGINLKKKACHLEKYFSGSNHLAKYNRIAKLFVRSHYDTIDVLVQRLDSTFTVHMRTYKKDEYQYNNIGKTLDPLRIVDNDIAIIDFEKMDTTIVDSIMTLALTCKAMIFDLRIAANEVCYLVNDYLSNEAIDFVKVQSPIISRPGYFRERVFSTVNHDTIHRYDGKIYILMNESTQSNVEFTIMVFQTYPDVTLIGTPTAGADGNISFLPLPGGIMVVFTGIGITYPDGTRTQRCGLQPDVWVRPDVRMMQRGTDNVMQRAILLAKEGLKRE